MGERGVRAKLVALVGGRDAGTPREFRRILPVVLDNTSAARPILGADPKSLDGHLGGKIAKLLPRVVLDEVTLAITGLVDISGRAGAVTTPACLGLPGKGVTLVTGKLEGQRAPTEDVPGTGVTTPGAGDAGCNCCGDTTVEELAREGLLPTIDCVATHGLPG